MDILALILTKFMFVFNLPYPVAYGVGTGLFEITIGSRTIAAAQADMLPKILSVSALLAFSGFSIIAQVMSVLAQTPIRLSFYLAMRFLQIILSIGLTMAGYLALAGHPAINSISIPFYKVVYSFDAWTFSIYSMALGIIIILIMIFFSVNISRD